MKGEKMVYRVTYQDDDTIKIVGDFDTLAKAEKVLREKAVELQAEAGNNGLNARIEWITGNKTFVLGTWEGETEYTVTYRECVCSIAAVDECGNYHSV